MIFRPDQFKAKQIELVVSNESVFESVVKIPLGEVVMVISVEVFEHYGPNTCVQLLTANGILWQEMSEQSEFFEMWSPLSKMLEDG